MIDCGILVICCKSYCEMEFISVKDVKFVNLSIKIILKCIDKMSLNSIENFRVHSQ